jgi:septum formation protein
VAAQRGAARLTLGSASPRRRELLATLGIAFDVVPSDVDETLEPGALPEAVARLALRKARAVAAGQSAGLVLAADTVVVVDGRALGKPADAAEARAMLRTLRGRTHEVMTGVALVEVATGRHAAETVVSRVTMAAYSDAVLDAYVAGGEPLDKAGAYAIQGEGGALVAGLEGSRSNVVGLPLETTAALLRRFGVAVSAAPPARGAGGRRRGADPPAGGRAR